MLPTDFLRDLDATIQRCAASSRLAVSRSTRPEFDYLPDLGRALDEATLAASARALELLQAHRQVNAQSPLFGSIALFRALGFHREEVAHTQTLGWLLDPKEEHEFGDAVLKCFLDAAVCIDDSTAQSRDHIVARLAGARVSTEHPLSKSCRADVLVVGALAEDNWSLVIEAKVDAVERGNQLDELLRTAPSVNKLGIFLTTTGDAGRTSVDAWALLSYVRWAGALIALMPTLRDKRGHPFLRMYVTGVLEDVCDIRCGTTPDNVLRNNNPFKIEQLLDYR